MTKNALVAALALVVVSGWLVGARAQEAPPPGVGPDPDPTFSIKGQPSYGTPAPGQVGGPVENHPELWTPEHLKEETEAVKEYCRTHDCSSAVVGNNYAPGWRESLDRKMRAWVSSHPSNVAPSNTIECRPDPANPNGLHLCYRASDHSRVYPGTPGPN
jgi:hypothetical protein